MARLHDPRPLILCDAYPSGTICAAPGYFWRADKQTQTKRLLHHHRHENINDDHDELDEFRPEAIALMKHGGGS